MYLKQEEYFKWNSLCMCMFWDYRHGLFLDICICCVYSLLFYGTYVCEWVFQETWGLKALLRSSVLVEPWLYLICIRFILCFCCITVDLFHLKLVNIVSTYHLSCFRCKCPLSGCFDQFFFPRRDRRPLLTDATLQQISIDVDSNTGGFSWDRAPAPYHHRCSYIRYMLM